MDGSKRVGVVEDRDGEYEVGGGNGGGGNDGGGGKSLFKNNPRAVRRWSSMPWRKVEGATLPAPEDEEDERNAAGRRSKMRKKAFGREVIEGDNHKDEVDLDVTKDDDGDNDDDNDEERFDLGRNHYDDPDADPSDLWHPRVADVGAGSSSTSKPRRGKRGRQRSPAAAWDPSASAALAEEGADDFGILFGVEVLDGSRYRVEKEEDGKGGVTTKLLVLDEGGGGRELAAGGNADAGADTAARKSGRRGGEGSDGHAATVGDECNVRGGDGGGGGGFSKRDDDMDDVDAAMKKLRSDVRKLQKMEAKLRKKKRKEQQQKDTKEQQKLRAHKRKDTHNTETIKDIVQDDAAAASAAAAAAGGDNHSADEDQIVGADNATLMESVRASWLSHTGVYLSHRSVCSYLAAMAFESPTPIQAATLAASMLGRRDVVGAAPTGSGKTLAYGLPIVDGILSLLQQGEGGGHDDDDNDDDDDDDDETTSKAALRPKTRRLPLTALVLVPTRELALQVTSEFVSVFSGGTKTEGQQRQKVEVCAVVGGMAEAKQTRLLSRYPPVVVATPGRLWELMSKEEHPHLTDLSRLRYLVIDEADRLVRQGSFPQLSAIFDAIRRANPPSPSPEDVEDDDDDDDDDDGDYDRLKGLTGVRGEARVEMLNNDVLEEIERQRRGESSDGVRIQDVEGRLSDEGGIGANEGNRDAPGVVGTEAPQPQQVDDEAYPSHQAAEVEDAAAAADDDYSDEFCSDDEESKSVEQEKRIHRQTFVYSATLTLPPSQHWTLKSKKVNSGADDGIKKRKRHNRGGKEGHVSPNAVEGAIAEMLERAGAMGQVKVVDLTLDRESKGRGRGGTEPLTTASRSPKATTAAAATPHLPPGLSLCEVKCAQRHKDSHLYAYLVSTRQGSSGPALVFCNSIAAVRRVGETLRALGLPVRTIHAKMAQKARLSALDSVKSTGGSCRAIVVATDVAARGLDIPSVSTVVHYDVARAVDTFIHRAGRTARGMGEKAVGTSISLVSPAEEGCHRKICAAVRGQNFRSLDEARIDGRLLSEAQARVALASKIVACEEVQSRACKKNKWFTDAAADAGLDIDEELLDGGLADGDLRDRQKLAEAKKAKAQLRVLLSKPMRTQHFGKFLSSAGAAEAARAESEVTPFVLSAHSPVRKRPKKKRKT